MSNKDMTLQVVVRMREEMQSGISSAIAKLNAFGNRAKAIFGGIGSAIGNLASKIGGLGIGTGMGLMGGLDSLVKYDAGLRDIAITAGLTGKAVEDFVTSSGVKMQQLAKDTGQVSMKLLEAHQLMTAANVETPAAQAMLQPIGKAATASNASIEDITKTAIASFQNAKIDPGQIETALAHMITGGKLGSFELKDMAQHYPTILAAMANLGVKGMEGIDSSTAMLQISKRTAGTTGEAATNLQDFLSGINSAHTIKRFKDHGVDLTGVIADAAGRGINPVEAVIQKIGKIIDQPKVVDEAMKRAKAKGLDPTKTQEEVHASVDQAIKAAGLGSLFVNQQSKMFLMAMLSNLPEYQDIKKQIKGAGNQVVDEDFASRMNGPEAKQRMATERVEQLMRRFGEALTGAFDIIGKFADSMSRAVGVVDGWNKAIVDTAVQLAALASGLGAIAFTLKMLGFGGGAAAAAVAVPGAGAAATAGTAGVFGTAVATLGTAASTLLAGATALSAVDWSMFKIFDFLGGHKNKDGSREKGALEKLGEWWSSDPESPQGSRQHGAWAKRHPYGIASREGRDFLEKHTPDQLMESFRESDREAARARAMTPSLYGYATGGGIGGAEPWRGPTPQAKPAPPPPPQKVDVAVTVKVDGPGTATVATTQRGANGDRGQTVGRP